MQIGIAVARFNQVITDRLLAGAKEELARAGDSDIEFLDVAGAWERPVAVLALLNRDCAGVVAIAAVIRGETDHYDVIVRESAAGLNQVAIAQGKPVGNAVLATEDLEQALARSEPGPGNKGAEAAAAVVDLARRLASF
ncbi:MAG: 6,7-dimethyl-8-ribityllumazine synthase [Acidimicrobiia bacterium]